jgi:hypothetical protein
MARRRYQNGCLFIRGKKRKVWIARWREQVISPENTILRLHRSEVLGPVSELSKKQAQSLLDSKLRTNKFRVAPAAIDDAFQAVRR